MSKEFRGRYRVIDLLGKGGSGIVYKVRDLVLEKEWALKEFYDKEKSFHKDMELQVLKKISHPCFPRIVDVFEEMGKIYFVMDLVEGVRLEEVIKKEASSEEKILDIGIRLAEALLFLHQLNPCLLYLDLKPSNIMIEESGEIKLIDFGSVMVKGSCVKVSGTPVYASPEQRTLQKEGSMLNEQSDIYSLGMVLFAMIQKETVKLPMVDGKQKSGIFIRRFQPVISKRTEEIIEKATRGDRNRRYGSMREFLSDMKKSREQLKRRKTILLLGKRKSVCVPFWQQEKSILCCDGKMIIQGIRLLVIILFLTAIIGTPAKAGKESRFQVFVKDEEGRKVLVKKDSVYEVKENLYFEIPMERMEEEIQIQIYCLKEGEKIGQFLVDCRKVP